MKQESEHTSSEPKSFIERLSSHFHNQPSNKTELLSMLNHMCKVDIIDHDALLMLHGVLNISDMCVDDIMIPRSQMIFISAEQTPEQFLPTIVESAHSRFPVIGEDKDDVIGILLAKDLIKHMHEKDFLQKPLQKNILRKAFFVPESKRLDSLLKQFRSNHNHLAVVVDEYGSVAGVVTIEDVLEEIVGEIEDEFDVEEAPMIEKIDENNYRINALLEIELFNETFHSNFSHENIDTIGGLIMLECGSIPPQGSKVSIQDFDFSIEKCDGRRIEYVHLHLKPKHEDTAKPDQNPS